MRLYIGLIHYPVYNKNHEKVASAITNFDIHDISRLARTYGVKRFFIVTPLQDQQRFAERIRNHWINGFGADYNEDRKEAIELLDIAPSLEDVFQRIAESEEENPLLIATDASEQRDKLISYPEAIDVLMKNKVILLLFGTAWGLHDELIDRADYILEPIKGNTDYNHLSVRTAAGIILDRLTGRCY